MVLLGASGDSVSAQKKFKEKYGFQFPLLADEERKLCTAFDVIKEKNMYGKKVKGIARMTFIIDEHGRIAHIFEKVKPEGHADEVLAALKE